MPSMSRRSLASLGANLGVGLGGSLLLARVARAAAPAETYPARSVRLVVPYPPGGATDVIARMLAEKLSAKWGQAVVADNRAGAGATVGAEIVARAAPDGYTLFETTSAHTISKSLYRHLSYDPVRDFTPITLTATVPLVLAVSRSVPAKTLPEFIAWAKAQPSGVTFGSTGNGTAQHLAGEMFKSRTGINAEHVPYRGDAPVITDLLGGLVPYSFCTLSTVLPYLKSGEIRPIAITYPSRLSALPDVPTFAEAGMPDFEAATWFGTFAPAGLPEALRERIWRDVSAIVAEPAMTQRLTEMGSVVNNLPPPEFEAFIAKETRRWAEAIRISGAQVN